MKTFGSQFTETAALLAKAMQNHCIVHLMWEHFLTAKTSLDEAIKKGKERKKWQKKKEVNGVKTWLPLREKQGIQLSFLANSQTARGKRGSMVRPRCQEASGAGPSPHPGWVWPVRKLHQNIMVVGLGGILSAPSSPANLKLSWQL